MIIALLILSTLLAIAVPIYPELTYSIVKCELVLYAAIIAIDIIKSRLFNLFHTWTASFIFIILSDMILCSANDPLGTYTIPIFFYLLGNNAVLLGYLLTGSNHKKSISHYKVVHESYLIVFIILSILLFVYLNFDSVVKTLAFGRILDESMGSTTFLATFVSALGTILPALIAYYFRYVKRKSMIYSILLVLPIFIMQFILATRFKLLFQILPFVIILGLIRVNRVTLKTVVVIVIAAYAFNVASTYLVENRNKATNAVNHREERYLTSHQDDIIYNLAHEMSPEGIMYMTSLANNYFDDHELSYGRECSTILYFWVPRAIWPDKPTQLDHWLIRKYENASDSFSSASGFLGELRADFGWFAILLAMLIGVALKKCDIYIQRLLNAETPSFGIVFASLLYPYFFFFVRSPLTASVHILTIYLIYIIIRRLFMKRIEYDEEGR